jgi:U3 small nucleolar RNA-associated protein 21
MWNMQSGIRRKTFNLGVCPAEVEHLSTNMSTKGGQRVVTGLASDALNRVVVASTLDGTINVSSCPPLFYKY